MRRRRQAGATLTAIYLALQRIALPPLKSAPITIPTLTLFCGICYTPCMENETVKTHETKPPSVPPELDPETMTRVMLAFNAAAIFFILLFDNPFEFGFFANFAMLVFTGCLGAIILMPFYAPFEIPLFVIGEQIYRAIRYRRSR